MGNNKVIITDNEGKLFKTKNNSKMYNLVEVQNKVDFLNEIVDKKIDELNREYQSKQFSLNCLKQIAVMTIGTEILVPMICYDGLKTLIPMTGILLVSGITSAVPIKIIKETDKKIDIQEQVIPQLQEELINSMDQLIKLKDELNKTEEEIKKIEDYDIKKYTEEDITYIYSEDKQKVKVKVR